MSSRATPIPSSAAARTHGHNNRGGTTAGIATIAAGAPKIKVAPLYRLATARRLGKQLHQIRSVGQLLAAIAQGVPVYFSWLLHPRRIERHRDERFAVGIEHAQIRAREAARIIIDLQPGIAGGIVTVLLRRDFQIAEAHPLNHP